MRACKCGRQTFRSERATDVYMIVMATAPTRVKVKRRAWKCRFGTWHVKESL